MSTEKESPNTENEGKSKTREAVISFRSTHTLKEQICKKAQDKGLSIANLIEYWNTLDERYNFIEDDWQKKVLEQNQTDLKEQIFHHAQKLGIAEEIKSNSKMREKVIDLRVKLLMKYIDSMPAEERKTFLGQALGEMTNITDFERALTENDLVKIDGVPNLVKMKDGKPAVGGVDPSQLYKCEVGWHVKGKFCKCPLYNSCPLKQVDRRNYRLKQESLKQGLKESQIDYEPYQVYT